MCTLRALGGIQLAGPGRSSGLPHSAARLRRLLAALAVRGGEVATSDWLVEAVWPDERPVNVSASLQTLMSRLRGLMAEVDGVRVVTRSPGYLLEVDADAFDVHVFERLAARGAALLPTDPAAAADTLDEALELWRGPAYGELADADFARAEAARLEELRSVAVEDRVDAGLALGRNHEVAARLEPLVAEHPLRERRRAQLMLARHRAGRSAEALEAYRDFRALLDEELGIEPSEQLQALHTAILRDEPALAWSPPDVVTVSSAASPAAERPTDSRRRGRRLFGRDEDVAHLRRLLAPGSTVTLTGPGGVGKTSLALAVAEHVADDFPDGTWLVELAPVTAPDAVPLAVASVLGVPARAGEHTVDRVVRWLSQQRALLLLDNCEHLPDAVAEVVAAVRREAAGVCVLATSQMPLSVEDEQVFVVRALATPDAGSDVAGPAVELFVARAKAHNREFALAPVDAVGPVADPDETEPDEGGSSMAAVAEICRRLDGLPLAIELAAARMRVMSPEDLVARLSGRFRLLHGGTRNAHERHRTLRALVDWSYDLLTPAEQRVFELLSAFAGAFTLEQAERLVTRALREADSPEGPEGPPGRDDPDPLEVADLVLGLVDRSMVASRAGAPTAYHLLETLRAYGRERLAGRGVAEQVQRVHAELFADLVADTRSDLYTHRHLVSAATVSASLDELRAAFGWAVTHDPSVAARIVAGTAVLLELRMTAEVAVWAERLLAGPLGDAAGRPAGVARDDEAWVHVVAAAGARFAGSLEVAAQRAGEALELADAPLTRCYATFLLTETTLFRGDLEAAGRLLASATALATDGGLDAMRRLLLATGALATAYSGGDCRAAADLAAVFQKEAEAHGEAVVAAWAAYARGEVLLEDDPAAAAPLLEEALDLARANGDRYLTGVTLVSAASARSRHGTPEEALPLFRDAVEHWHRDGNWTHQWTTLRNVAVLLARLGRDLAAATVDGAVLGGGAETQPFGAEAARLTRMRDGLVARLGSEGYDEAARRGAAMGREELFACVVGELTGAAGRT